MSGTKNYNLEKPAKGTKNWDASLNINFDIIDEKLGVLEEKGSYVLLGKYISTQDNTSVFQIPESTYNPEKDTLLLKYKGIELLKDENYTQNGLEITLGFTINKDEIITYEITKISKILDDDLYDGSLVQDRSINKNKLTSDVIERIDKVDLLEEQLSENTNQIKNIESPYDYQGAVFTFISDDGNNRDFDTFKPLFDSKNIKVTFGIITNYIVNGNTSTMTIDKLKQLQNEGHEIVSHSKTHSSTIWHDNLASVTDSQIETELKDSQQWLKDNGFNCYDTLVYPYGNFGSEAVRIKRLARKYYSYAINSVGSYNASPVDNMYINRYQLNMATISLDAVKAKIDEAITNKGWLVFLMHGGSTTEVDASYIGSVIDYIQSLNGTILPFRQASSLKGNVVSIGEFTSTTNKLFVGIDGKVSMSSDANLNYLIRTGIYTDTVGNTMDDPINKYTQYKTTVVQIKTDPLTGVGGVLSTYYGDYNFSYQSYISTNMRYFIRYWNESSSTWGAWNEIVIGQRLKFISGIYTSTAGNTMDDSITKYDKYKITITQIQGGTKDPLTTEGGTIETHRWDENYSYQRFVTASTGRIYHRKWIGTDISGNWGAWQSLTNLSGTTTQRPDIVYVGQQYLDTTLNKLIICKSVGTKEVDTLTITSGATSSGNITITVSGVTKTIAVVAGDSAQTVADKIRATVFTTWGTNKYITINVGGTGTSVTFSKYDPGVTNVPSFADTGTTGVTASFVVTTVGTNNAWIDATGATV